MVTQEAEHNLESVVCCTMSTSIFELPASMSSFLFMSMWGMRTDCILCCFGDKICEIVGHIQGRIQGGGYGGSSPPLPESGRVYSVRTRSVT